MPLTSEKINEFAVSKRDREHRAEEDYHDGTIFINVINQDEKLPYWFRQDHPFVFHDYYRLVSTTKSRVYFRLAISGDPTGEKLNNTSRSSSNGKMQFI